MAITKELEHDNRYNLLYDSNENTYYHMQLVGSFILYDVLFMTVMLPLRQSEAPVLSIYKLNSHFLPTNMSDNRKAIGSYTRSQIDQKYIAVKRNQFSVLDNNFTLTTLHINIYMYKQNHYYYSKGLFQIALSPY